MEEQSFWKNMRRTRAGTPWNFQILNFLLRFPANSVVDCIVNIISTNTISVSYITTMGGNLLCFNIELLTLLLCITAWRDHCSSYKVILHNHRFLDVVQIAGLTRFDAGIFECVCWFFNKKKNKLGIIEQLDYTII